MPGLVTINKIARTALLSLRRWCIWSHLKTCLMKFGLKYILLLKGIRLLLKGIRLIRQGSFSKGNYYIRVACSYGIKSQFIIRRLKILLADLGEFYGNESMPKRSGSKVRTTNFVLVIQGPMLSRGRTGKTIHISGKDLKPEHIVDYDCRDNIRKLIDCYGGLFDDVQLVTWEGELTERDQKDHFSDIHISILEDKTPKTWRPHEDRNPTLINNKFRQSYSSYEGLKAVFQRSPDSYCIRIRTDQWVDLFVFKSFIQANVLHNEAYEDSIFVPAILGKNGPCLFDYYFAGCTGKLMEFFYSHLAFNCLEFQDSPHTDLYYKYMYHLLKDKTDVPVTAYLAVNNRDAAPKAFMRKIVEYHVLNNIIVPLPKELHSSLIWRGERITDNEEYLSRPNFKDAMFYEDWVRRPASEIISKLIS